MSLKNSAIITDKPGVAKHVELSIPKLRDDYVLIKVKAVALNPTDWKHVDFLTAHGARIGCDYAGIVEEVGSKVTKDFKKGDRICGFAHGGNEVHQEDGAFGEYITAKGDIQIKIPDNLSFEEASTLGVGITTVGQAMYQALGLPLPNTNTNTSEKKQTLLIYGGSTATGSLAIQYANLSNLNVVVTCSPRNYEYVKSLGADAAFDYKSPTCSEDINKYTNDALKYAFDCISEGDSPAISVSAMGSAGGVYTTLLPVQADQVKNINAHVELKQTLGYTVVGEYFRFGPRDFPAKPEDLEFGKMFWDLSARLLAEGKVKVHRPSVDKYGQGFEGILKGLDALRGGKVSGEKLVFTL